MKKINLIFILILQLSLLHGQNKKEIMQEMSFRIDSLNIQLKQRDSIILVKNSKIELANQDIDNFKSQLGEQTKQLQLTKDSLRTAINQYKVHLQKSESSKCVVKITTDSVKISQGDYEGEIMKFSRVSISDNLNLEEKINEAIAIYFNMSMNYKCDPNLGFDNFVKNVSTEFKNIHQWNYFHSYDLFIKSDEHLLLIIYDESFNILWFDIHINKNSFDLKFNRMFLDDPKREH